MRATKSVRRFPNVAFNTVRLIDDGPFLSFQRILFSASAFHAALLQATGGVMLSTLSPQVVLQAPQHIRSSWPLAIVANAPRDYMLGHFPRLRHVQVCKSLGERVEGRQRALHHPSVLLEKKVRNFTGDTETLLPKLLASYIYLPLTSF